MPNNAFGASIDLEIPAADALAAFTEVSHALGRLIEDESTEVATKLKMVIGAGFLNMNPAVVDVEISSLGDQKCRVTITGSAKEGLIRQRAGEGAVRRVLAAIRFGAPPASDIPRR